MLLFHKIMKAHEKPQTCVLFFPFFLDETETMDAIAVLFFLRSYCETRNNVNLVIFCHFLSFRAANPVQPSLVPKHCAAWNTSTNKK